MLKPTPLGIWLVEDHGPLRETMCEAMVASSLGPVEIFGSCEAALAFLKSTNAPPAVVIMDIGLPGMSGLEGLRELKTASPTSEILMFTVFDDRRRVLEAIGAGASGYLLKSESLERIIAAVGEVIRGGSPMTPEIARIILKQLSRPMAANGDVALSDREIEVLRALAEGLTKKEIASRLNLSMHTIDNYVRRIYAKLHVNSLGGAVAKALRDGLL